MDCPKREGGGSGAIIIHGERYYIILYGYLNWTRDMGLR